LVKWTYDLRENLTPEKGEDSKYYKALGSFNEVDLNHVIKTDGLDKMIVPLEFDSDEVLDDWLADNKAHKRKEYIMSNDFSIAKL